MNTRIWRVDLGHPRDSFRVHHRVDDASMAASGDDDKAFLKVEKNSCIIPFMILDHFAIHHRVEVLQHFVGSHSSYLPGRGGPGHQVQWFTHQRENGPLLLELHLTLSHADMANPIRVDLKAWSENLGMRDNRDWPTDSFQNPWQPVRMVIMAV